MSKSSVISGGIAGLVAFAVVFGSSGAAQAATSIEVDFSDPAYVIGVPYAPATQNGWTRATNVSANWALVDSDVTYPASPLSGKALRFGNNAADGGIAQLIPPVIDAVGEPGLPGATGNVFEMTFTIASTTTGAPPTGLNVDLAIGSASRYGGVVNLYSTGTGIAVGSYWVPSTSTAVGALSDWYSTVFTTITDFTVAHDIRVVVTFLAGASDLFDVYVDNVLVSAGSGATSWEYYHAIANPGNPKRTVTDVSFRASGSRANPVAGAGYITPVPLVAAATPVSGYLFGSVGAAVVPAAVPAAPTLPNMGSEIDVLPIVFIAGVLGIVGVVLVARSRRQRA